MHEVEQISSQWEMIVKKTKNYRREGEMLLRIIGSKYHVRHNCHLHV